MDTSILKTIKDIIRNWYIPLLVGLFFVVIGIIALTSPASSILALSVFFALSFLFGGFSEVVFSVTNRHKLDNWGWSLAFGLISIVVGLSLTMRPALSLNVMTLFVGFGVLFRSVAAISLALDMRSYGIDRWSYLIILGSLGAILSILLISNPLFTGLSIVMLIGLNFFFAGLFSIYFSLQLRKLNKNSKTISPKLQEKYDNLLEEIRLELEE